ncbi:MAG TPA: hypothetical protein VMT15_14360 [Bryobacteraceae bacterium]|nr:hypothetical protein [Bryobacteraceae bacterium]
MTTVITGTETFLASMTDPHQNVPATIVSVEGRRAELALQGESSLEEGALVQFQSPGTLYFGEIESKGQSGRARILIEHSVDLERAAAIRRLWNTENVLQTAR